MTDNPDHKNFFFGGLLVPQRWHEQMVNAAWEKIKASGNVVIQRWPLKYSEQLAPMVRGLAVERVRVALI